jgi:hypothetical protein
MKGLANTNPRARLSGEGSPGAGVSRAGDPNAGNAV